jgi:hypothetical protein
MKSSAIQALTNSGDGSALPAVRCLIGDAQPGANSVFGALEYISHCGGRDDLTSIERLARRQIAAAGPFSLDVAFEATRSMYMIAGPSVIPLIRSIVADVPMSESKLWGFGEMTDSRVLPDIAAGLRTGQPAVRALAADLLARWGRPEGLPAAAEVASVLGLETRIRAQALGVFQSFKGPRLQRFLLDVLKASQPQPAQIRFLFDGEIEIGGQPVIDGLS